MSEVKRYTLKDRIRELEAERTLLLEHVDKWQSAFDDQCKRMRELEAVLRKTLRQLDDYRETLIDSEFDLCVHPQCDLIRTRIHLRLRSKTYVGYEAEAVLSRSPPPDANLSTGSPPSDPSDPALDAKDGSALDRGGEHE